MPGLGQSTPQDWRIDGPHLAERCAGFVLIGLGESLVVTGAAFADMAWDRFSVEAFAAAFMGCVAMWAIYFNIGAERASHHIATADDPGRLGRSGYTYLHLLIVAGIIVSAVADGIALAHPHGRAEDTARHRPPGVHSAQTCGRIERGARRVVREVVELVLFFRRRAKNPGRGIAGKLRSELGQPGAGSFSHDDS